MADDYLRCAKLASFVDLFPKKRDFSLYVCMLWSTVKL